MWKRIKVYVVPGERDETVYVTGPSADDALMFVSVPLKWRTKLTLLFILGHCRVMLLSFCPITLNPL